jgi:beta-N-acetylhexosaminidase
MDMGGHRTRRVLAAAAAGSVLAACGSGGSPGATSGAGAPASTAAPAPAATPLPTFSGGAPEDCLSATDIAGWPVDRRAATVIAMPLNGFDFGTITTELAAGAGGVLLLGTSTPPADLAARIHAAGAAAGGVAPPLVMADEEGGGVQRLLGAVPDLPWPRDLASTEDDERIELQAAGLGRAMAALGVNVDLAPVLDVDARPGPSDTDPDGQRSFSGDPAVVSRDGVAFMRGLREGGVLPVVKHFPGLGGATGNTDVRPASTKPIAELRADDLGPFRAAITAGAPAVMISNATVPGESTHPASLSSAVIDGLLRGQLGFTGLVVTDSLSAGAVTAATASLGEAAADAIESGADLVLFGSTRTDADVAALSADRLLASFQQVVAALRAALASGALTDVRLNAADAAVLRARGTDVCG